MDPFANLAKLSLPQLLGLRAVMQQMRGRQPRHAAQQQPRQALGLQAQAVGSRMAQPPMGPLPPGAFQLPSAGDRYANFGSGSMVPRAVQQPHAVQPATASPYTGRPMHGSVLGALRARPRTKPVASQPYGGHRIFGY